MKGNILHLLLSTSLLATNVVPAAQPIPDVVIQAANTAVEEQAPTNTPETSSTQEEVTDPAKAVSENSSEQQTEDTQHEATPESEKTENSSTNKSEDSAKAADEETKETSEVDQNSKTEDSHEEDVQKPDEKSNDTKSSGTWGTAPWTFDETTGTLTISAGELLYGKSPWDTGAITKTSLKKIKMDGNIIAPYSCSAMFLNLQSLTEIEGLGNLDTSHVTAMDYMFDGCTSLTSLDLGSLDTSHVDIMNCMLRNCTSLTSLDLSNFNTVSNGTSVLTGMFAGDNNLRSLTLGPKSLFNESANLPEGVWVGQNSSFKFNSTSEFVKGYDGSQPDTFIRYDGFWGTAPWNFDAATGTVTVYSGELGVASEAPWYVDQIIDRSSVKKIEFSGKVIAPKDSGNLFATIAGLKEFDGTNLDTSQVTNMSNMFAGDNITNIDVSSFDTSHVTNMARMFLGCRALSLDVSSFDTSHVTDMNYMFYGCSSLTSLDLSDFDTKQVTDMTRMFYGCSSLTSLDVSGFDTKQVTDMTSMFSSCKSLINLDLSSFDTSHVTNMTNMFMSSSSLTSLDLSGFDTSHVTNMTNMFGFCTALKSLDLSGFDTSQVTNMSGAFGGCVPDELTLGSKTILQENCGLSSSVWKGKNTSVIYTSAEELIKEYDGSQPDTFVRYDGVWGTALWNFDEATGTLTVYSGELGTFNESPWNRYAVGSRVIKKIEFTEKVTAPQDSSYLFSDGQSTNLLTALTEVTGLENFDTSQVTTMKGMFAGCSQLNTIDLSNFETSLVYDLTLMFDGCTSLKELNLSNFDTSNVTYINETFKGCTSLEELNLSSWDTTSKNPEMKGTFKDCTSLAAITLGAKTLFKEITELPEGGWVGSSTDVHYKTTAEFLNGYDGSNPDTYLRLSALDLWGTAPYWFDEATGTLNVYSGDLGTSKESPWNTSNVDATKIKKIDLKEKMVAPQDSSYLFSTSGKQSLGNLAEIKGMNNLDTSQVTNMNSMFQNCSKLESLDLSNFDTNQVVFMGSMFSSCKSLINLDLSSFDTSHVASMASLFYNCDSLKTLDLSNFDAGNLISGTGALGMFEKCSSLSSITLGSNFNAAGKGDSRLPDHRWIGLKKLVRFGSSTEFMDGYDGSQPDTYVWDQTAQLDLAIENNDTFTIGQQDTLSWTVHHTDQSEQGRTAKDLKGKLTTTEDVIFGSELTVETTDSLGVSKGISKVPLTYVGATDGKSIYSYDLPDLAYGESYKVSVSMTPWNNTTISSDPTFIYDLAYDANLKGENGDIAVPDSLTKNTDQVIDNGTLGFKELPASLEFNTEKLTSNLNEQLIPRQKEDWQIGISDFRGTKAYSVDDNTVARQDWELLATAGAFKDSTNQEVPQEALNVAYVDDQGVIHELSETNETLLTTHEVSGETPKTNNYEPISWSKDKGLQAIVHDRNAVEADETYQTDVTFELRSAP